MKDYNSITFKNSAIDRLTVETTKPEKSAQEMRRDEDYKKVSSAEFQKKQEEKKKEAQRLARRKGL